jgi:Domain of unknown function (DUF4406)
MKYFISGAISQYASTPEGRKEVSDKFMGAEFDLLTSQKATEVFNPIRLVDEYGWNNDWKFYMAICLQQLLYCDAIYMLKGWENSKGAILLLLVAEHLKLKIVCEDNEVEYPLNIVEMVDFSKPNEDMIKQLQNDLDKANMIMKNMLNISEVTTNPLMEAYLKRETICTNCGESINENDNLDFGCWSCGNIMFKNE